MISLPTREIALAGILNDSRLGCPGFLKKSAEMNSGFRFDLLEEFYGVFSCLSASMSWSSGYVGYRDGCSASTVIIRVHRASIRGLPRLHVDLLLMVTSDCLSA